MSQTHQQVVAAQFGPRAQAYVASTVHSSGPDLDWLEMCVKNRAADALLDVGCGGGHVAFRLAEQCANVTACDPSEEMVAIVQKIAAQRGILNIEAIRASAESLPLINESFDIAVARFSSHHWENLDKGLHEINRVLKQGGQLFIIDTISPAKPLLDTHLQAIELLRDPSHVRDYSVAEWMATLGRTDFALGDVRTTRIHIEFELWAERMRTPDSTVATIRTVMDRASSEVKNYFGFDDSGNFWLDTIWIRADKTTA